MRRVIFMLVFVIAGLSVVQAQTARQLYLGYENNDQMATAPTNDSAAKKKGKPGAKVTIERFRDGKLKFVNTKTTFKSGDKIRLRFATNFDGYIKILNVGSSGRVTLLYPYAGANNRIVPSDSFQVPKGDAWIVFDDTPGTEMLTVIMSSVPFENDNDLVGSSSRSAGSRDLFIESDEDATYVIASETSLEEPIGFTLKLKHK